MAHNLNFTVFTDKILSGEKRQTICPAEKYRDCKPGDTLVLREIVPIEVRAYKRDFGCQEVRAHIRRIRRKLGTAVVSEVVPIRMSRYVNKLLLIFPITTRSANVAFDKLRCIDLARNDGFKNTKDMCDFFVSTYDIKEGDSKEFVIIRWTGFEGAR